jgi:hypothetical protein
MTKIDRPDDVSHAELNAIVHNLLGTHDGGKTRALPANRHERRRRAVVVEKRQVALSEIGGAACGWRSCPVRRQLDGLPDGWSHIIGHATPPKKALLNLGTDESPRPVLDLGRLAWRHDVTLCPQHTKMLADLLYADPGADPLLSQTAGRA